MFLPRSVQISSKSSKNSNEKKKGPSLTPCSSSGPGEETPAGPAVRSEVSAEAGTEKEGEAGSEDDEEDDQPVVSYSKHQRWPEPGEPVCVMCGRYGAYIVDATDHDVCSLECKARHLHKLGRSQCSIPTPSDKKGEEPQSGWGYMEHPEVVTMTPLEVERLRAKMRIRIDGNQVPKPISSLEHLALPERLLSNLQASGYADITPIQMQVIPAALYRRDLLACAATGSGKTLSFLLPIILHLVRGQGGLPHPQLERGSGTRALPKALVLCPTRELAMQIEDQAKQLMQGLPQMKTALVVGGLPSANQLHRLKSGVQVVVATPARLNDLLDHHPEEMELADIEIFVLDEVDCLLSMGFEPQVRMVEELLPRVRQNLMFSATIPPAIARLAKTLMAEPITITVGEPSTPCDAVKHTILWVEETSKRKKLLAFLKDGRHFNPPVVVFVNSKKGTLLLADSINKSDIPHATAVGLHGDMVQERRSEILRTFLEGKHSIMVATNVLGRGVDLVNVRQVFIFDMPTSLLDFIHQVGRAGRMGAAGSAVTFINNSNKAVFLSFSEMMARMGVALPPQLTSSPHLALQREKRKQRPPPSATPPHKRAKTTDSWKLKL